MKYSFTTPLRTATIAAALLTCATTAAQAQWRLTPYVWATGVTADVSIHGATPVHAHVPFSDLLKDVDQAAMLRLEYQHGRLGTSADLFYVGMSHNGAAVTLPNGTGATLDAKLDLTVLDATASYGRRRDGLGLAFTAGIRLVGEGTELQLHLPTSPTTSVTEETDVQDVLVNGIVGLRFRRPLTRRLSIEAHADIGAGETERTWSGGSELRFALGASRRYALHAGYKTMTIDFKEDNGVQTDLRMSGLLTGFRIAF